MRKAMEQKFQDEEIDKELQIAQLQHEIGEIEQMYAKIIEEKKCRLETELIDL